MQLHLGLLLSRRERIEFNLIVLLQPVCRHNIHSVQLTVVFTPRDITIEKLTYRIDQIVLLQAVCLHNIPSVQLTGVIKPRVITT